MRAVNVTIWAARLWMAIIAVFTQPVVVIICLLPYPPTVVIYPALETLAKAW